MKISISFFLCSAFYIQHSFAYAAIGPVVDDGHSCVILTPSRCPKKNCDCKNYITFNPKSWYRAFLASVNGKKCKCESCIQKPKKVKCKNGVCDKKNQKCVCDYCWVGEVCDKFKNKYAPEFEDTQQVVTIPKSHPTHLPVTRVAAFDNDLNYCNGASCPCGEIAYKLRKDFGIFKIDTYTGAISITRTPDSSQYLLMVTASNNLDDESTKEGYINVTIKVTDSTNVPLTDHKPDYTSHDMYDGIEDEEYNYPMIEDDSHHSRKRRSVSDVVVHPLVVTAEPKLSTTYYFNKNEKIVFQVKAMNNDTSKSITSVTVKASSVWLKLENLNVTASSDASQRFSSTGLTNNVANFQKDTIQPNQKFVMAEITGVVNASVTPLANLNLDLDVEYTYDGQAKTVAGLKSSPIVYSVFPEVNVTRQQYSVSTYGNDIDIDMKMKFPLLNYRLLVELTSNVECFVFMEVKDVNVVVKNGVTHSGSTTPVYHTSDKSNGLNDRAVIDFGDITVSDSSPESERLITISYKLGVKDHANVANGSTHYAGAGLQAGPSILWVEQQDFEITKIEPALEVSYNKSAIDNSSRLFIGDFINIEYRVDHTSTSEEIAKKVKISLDSKYLKPKNSGALDSNGTFHSIKTVTDTLNLGKILSGVFEMEVGENIDPLEVIPAVLHVEYENQRNVKKFPLRMDVTLPLTGTPYCSFERINGQGDIVFGNEIEFELVIWLSKMHAKLQVEFVLPKYGNDGGNGTALMHILSIDMVNIGDNIEENGARKQVTTSPKYYSTSDNARWRDQAVWDLGDVTHKASDVSNTSVNQIKFKLKALVLEVQNVTSGTQFKVGAGVIGLPRMIWVGQIDTNVRIEPMKQPKMEFLHKVIDATQDEYGHEISFKHANESDQFAYNVTFEYYLPPYVEYIREEKTVANVIKARQDRARFTYTGPFTFLDNVTHGIRVRLRREYSPKTGRFEFMIPCALTYTNYQHKRWQYWRSAKRDIHVRSRAPTIPKDSRANSNYYGRGMYLDDTKNEIFVCMNMHLPSSRPACYRSLDNGNSWSAMDSRVGCVLGHHNNQLYAIGRNQVIMIRYNDADKDWYLLNEDEKATLGTPFTKFKDFTSVDTLEPSEIALSHQLGNKLWGVTDEGVYYRASTNGAWTKKANWRL